MNAVDRMVPKPAEGAEMQLGGQTVATGDPTAFARCIEMAGGHRCRAQLTKESAHLDDRHHAAALAGDVEHHGQQRAPRADAQQDEDGADVQAQVVVLAGLHAAHVLLGRIHRPQLRRHRGCKGRRMREGGSGGR